MLTATSVPLHVDVTGHGPPIVLLHGWALHGGLFEPLVDALSVGHRVLNVDLPGHGASAAPAAWTLDAIVDALEHRFADTAQRLVVLGWSLGGAVALRWAVRSPSRIARLVLVCTTPKFVASPDWPHAMEDATLARFGDELRIAYRATLMRFLTLQVQGSDQAHATLAALRRHVFARGVPDTGTLAASLSMLRAIDLRDDVHDVDVPALVVAGARDTLAPPDAGRWLAGALPRGRFALIAGAGHAPFLSHPREFAAAVVPFTAHG